MMPAKLLTAQNDRLVISIIGNHDDVIEAANAILKLDKRLTGQLKPVKNDDSNRKLIVLVLPLRSRIDGDGE